MTDKLHEPAYRAAYESAQTEIAQIYERLSQLRARQEQIQVAADALKMLVGSDQSFEAPSNASKQVFEISTKDFLQNSPQQTVEEDSSDPIQQHIKNALRVPALA